MNVGLNVFRIFPPADGFDTMPVDKGKSLSPIFYVTRLNIFDIHSINEAEQLELENKLAKQWHVSLPILVFLKDDVDIMFFISSKHEKRHVLRL